MSNGFIEGLESRRLLSSTLASGTLTVTGSNNADNVSLTISGSNLRVSENGAVKNFVLSAVKMIKVSGLGGNDTVTLANNLNVRAVLDGGAGDDKTTRGANTHTPIRRGGGGPPHGRGRGGEQPRGAA